MLLPIPIAPFEVAILPLQMHDAAVVETAERIYAEVSEQGVDVLLDDRNERAGVKFNDADLLGIPVRVTVGARGVKNGEVEIKLRDAADGTTAPLSGASNAVLSQVAALYDSLK
jgi:prolyl-tRNA synthetase